MTNKPLYLICIVLVLLVRTQVDHMADRMDRITMNSVLFFFSIGLCYLTYKEFVKGE